MAEEVVCRDVACYARLGFASLASYAVMCDRDYFHGFGPPPVLAYGEALRPAYRTAR